MKKDRKPTIEINGHTYNAITGEQITSVPTNNTKPKPINTDIPHANGVSIDGFISAIAATRSQPIKAGTVHHPKKKSQTLKRELVEAPAADSVNIENDKPESSAKAAAKHGLARSVQPKRKARAQGQIQSRSIAKFSEDTNYEPTPEVAEEPNEPPSPPPTNLSTKEQLIAQKLAQVANLSVEPELKLPFAARFRAKFFNNRTASILATSMAAVLVVGYVTYLNIPRMTLRVASSRAGFEAQLPGYSPGGFKFSGPVAYAPGQVTIQYSSNTDDRNYSISQKKTTWDSETLLDNYVAQESELYSTYQERGLTVYIYDGSNATWVNGGVWYTVSGESLLTSEQLLKIAASL